MNARCVETGTIQAFLDGELEPAMSAALTNHVAECDKCARALAEAEEQSAVVFSLLEREFDTLVPTHRLWTRINESIDIEKSSRPAWRRFLDLAGAQLANPSLAAAAGLLIVFGLIAAVWSLRNESESEIIPMVAQNSPTTNVSTRPADVSPSVTAPSAAVTTAKTDSSEFVPVRAVYRGPVNASRINSAPSAPGVSETGYLPGEESYVKAIADLKQTVESRKDEVMRPSLRVAFESDMALVDDTIEKMRREVRKNPRNNSAKQMLYSSYQNKIDLLNSVAQREELMASLK